MSVTGPPLNATYMAAGELYPHATFNALLDLLNGGAGAPAWVSWTPTLTNLTLGNGVVVAKYMQIGKLVFCRLSIVLGSTSAVSGAVQFSLPVTRVAFAGVSGVAPLGLSRFYDLSALTAYEGNIISTTTTTGNPIVFNAAGTYLSAVQLSSTIPFTWVTGDEIGTEFFYEAA